MRESSSRMDHVRITWLNIRPRNSGRRFLLGEFTKVPSVNPEMGSCRILGAIGSSYGWIN